MRLLVAALVTFFIVNTVAFAAGDLTRQEPIEVTVELGTQNGELVFQPSNLEFETGKLYKLILTNPSPVKHYFTSAEFAKRIFTRKVQVMIDGKRTAEIKGDIAEIEVFPGGTTEWWFVPVQTGKAKDLHCHVKDKASGMKHDKLGMTGSIVIK